MAEVPTDGVNSERTDEANTPAVFDDKSVG